MIRFVLLGHPRSGSTLLALALWQHPRIRMYGELFSDEGTERRHAVWCSEAPCAESAGTGRSGTPGFYCLSDRGDRFLRENVFRQGDRDRVSATGFKLFYHQARHPSRAATAWTYLEADRRIHVVHLRRRNLLAALTSLRLAMTTGKWACPLRSDEPDEPPLRIRLETEECVDYFSSIKAAEKDLATRFAAHPCLELEYERDVCEHFLRTSQRIHEFLEVPPHTPVPMLRKQSQGKLADHIENYDELRSYFSGSAYAAYFLD